MMDNKKATIFQVISVIAAGYQSHFNSLQAKCMTIEAWPNSTLYIICKKYLIYSKHLKLSQFCGSSIN